jgi:hypothetical protein
VNRRRSRSSYHRETYASRPCPTHDPCASVRYNKHIVQNDSQIVAHDGKTNAEILLARLLDVHAVVDTLVQDVIDAVGVLDVRQPARSRAFVRSTFALVEGALNRLVG